MSRANIICRRTGRTLWSMIVPHNWTTGAVKKMAYHWYLKHKRDEGVDLGIDEILGEVDLGAP